MDDSLNSAQQAGVTYMQGPLMILAGAGTGKTRVITHRIAFLLKNGVAPEGIVALTFTNKAAREMQERLTALVGSAGNGLFCGTFHSFCLFLLRTHHAAAGLERRFGLIGTSDQVDLVKKALEHEGWAGLYRPDEIHARISNAKNNLLTPEDLRAGRVGEGRFTEKDPELVAKIYSLYERQLRLNHVIDFDDCILKVVRLLEDRADVLADVRNKFEHLLVDEFQDTNFAQLKVVTLVAAGHQRICVVGDDDQSIYSWRGAMVETMLRFEDTFRGTLVVKLEQNYRCSNVILGAANSVIKHNTQRKDKTLWSASKVMEPIILAEHEDDQSEARWIAKKCFGFLGQGLAPHQIAVLFRTNGQARSLEEAFREYNLSYQLVGGTSFFDRKEVRDFLAYVRLVAHPDDRLSFYRAINTPSRGVGLKSLEAIDEATKVSGGSPFKAVVDGKVTFKSSAGAAVKEFVDGLEALRCMELNTPEDVEKLGRSILTTFRLENEIKQKTDDPNVRQWKLELLGRLPLWLRNLSESQYKDRGRVKLAELLDRLTLSDDKDRADEGGKKITFMTIHGAKGLEWPVVFLCGVEEELLPHKNSAEDAHGVAEERRLMYVAMTRAKDRLLISHCRERALGFKRADRKPSRFLKEIPPEGVLREDARTQALSEQERKESGLRKLGSLRERIKTGFA